MTSPKRPTCKTCGGILASAEERKTRICWLCVLIAQWRAAEMNGKETARCR